MGTLSLGIDIGNVIINHRLIDKNDKTLLEKHYSTIPAVDGVFDAIKKLNKEKFHGDIFLISKCTPWAQEKILAWLKDNDFYGKTGVEQGNVYFCRERHEKEKICRELGVTHFVDDRLEVLSHMVEKIPNLYLFQPCQSEVSEHVKYLPNVHMVENWGQLLREIN